MTQWLEERLGIYEYYFTDDPNAMIGILCERMDDIVAISLDHDLFDRAVTPFDDTTWVGNDWYPTLKKAIRHFADRK